jgi:hypothetical protein
VYQRCRDLFGSCAPDRRGEASPPPAIVRKPGCRGSRAEARLRRGMGSARSTKWPHCSRSCTLRSDIPGAFSGSAWPLRKSSLGCCVIGPRSRTVFGLGSRDSAGWLSSRQPCLGTIKTATRWSNPRGALQSVFFCGLQHQSIFASSSGFNSVGSRRRCGDRLRLALFRRRHRLNRRQATPEDTSRPTLPPKGEALRAHGDRALGPTQQPDRDIRYSPV